MALLSREREKRYNFMNIMELRNVAQRESRIDLYKKHNFKHQSVFQTDLQNYFIRSYQLIFLKVT